MEWGNYRSMLKCAEGVRDKTIINRIMLRFRPIAPKPVTGYSVSGEPVSGNQNLVVTSRVATRKYVRVCEKNNRKRKYVRVCEKNNRKRRILDDDENKGFVTLQLMPEKADLEKSMAVGRSCDVDDDIEQTVGKNCHIQDPPSLCLQLRKMVAADDVVMMRLSDQTKSERRMTVVESWVTAEGVTDTCMDEGEMGNCTDFERMKNLEKDTCPGFLSDGLNRVLWVNQAYKNAVGLYGSEQTETAVGLVVKDGFIFPHDAFSCHVRLQYVDGKGKRYSKTVPCDVWKMSCGGFAWRLDVKAALSLGL